MPVPVAETGPSDVAAEAGQIVMDGPNGVAVTMSADAAEETARRLLAAAGEARQQSLEEGCARI